MKTVTKRILETFPNMKLQSAEQPDQLNDIQSVFFSLALFFEHPDKHPFELNLLYKHLENDWLEFALALVTEFFQKDTYLIQKPNYSLITELDQYKNQTQVAMYLTDHQVPYSSAKIKTYYDRGKFPAADLVVAGQKFWTEQTIQTFIDQELEKHSDE